MIKNAIDFVEPDTGNIIICAKDSSDHIEFFVKMVAQESHQKTKKRFLRNFIKLIHSQVGKLAKGEIALKEYKLLKSKLI